MATSKTAFLVRCGRMLILALIVSLLGCHSSQDISIVERGMAAFRANSDMGKYQDIYAHADAELRSQATEQEFYRVLQKANKRLGKAERSELMSFQRGWFTNRGLIITTVYKTQFVRGAGTETFVWKIVDDGAVLVGYHVTSDVLNEAGESAATPASSR